VTLVDRVAVLMGRRKIRCVVEGGELFKPFLDRGKGVILVGAHHGCWELGGHFLTDYNVPVNLVVIDRELAGIQKLFDSASDSRRFRILTTDDNPLRGLPILAALRRGEIVALLGDRSFGSSDVEVDFLGGKASIPIGPYRLAAASGAPLFHVSVVREKFGCYRFSAFAPEFISRHEARTNPDAAPDCARRYARRLESVVRQYPFQWANFFAFWEPKSGTARASSAKPSPC
jgi:lauroyl/myristoyl acyltransferase